MPFDFIIATTKVVNGSTLLRSLVEPIDNRLKRAHDRAASVASAVSSAVAAAAADGGKR